MKQPREIFRFEGEKIKGSRFIAVLAPIASENDIQGVLQEIRSEYSQATHCCFAWRRKDDTFRSSDDGEPHGSAGEPILRRLLAQDVVDVLLVVVRYFGGTKLGVGGLVRAYGQAANKVLERAQFSPVQHLIPICFEVEYGLVGAIEAVLRRYEISQREQAFGESVSFQLGVDTSDARSLYQAIVDATSGRVQWLSPAV